jgi:hypothetical protein
MVISARSQYGITFYMLVSQAFYSLALGSALTEGLSFAKKNTWKGWTAWFGALAAVISIFLPKFLDSHTRFNLILVQSDKFRDSFEEIDRSFNDQSLQGLKMILVIEELMDYQYVDGGMLTPFIPKGFPIEDSKISWELKSVYDSSPKAVDAVYILFDKDMNLENIVKPSPGSNL